MKQLFLLIISALSFQSTIFPMERPVQEVVNQGNEAKTKSATIASKAMIYKLSSGNFITLNANAVRLCDQLVGLLDFSQKDFNQLFSEAAVGEIPFKLDLTDSEAVVLFDTLNTITQSTRFYTDENRQKRYYLNEDVFNITVKACKQNNLLKSHFLIKMINACDFLQCDTLLNAFTRQLIEGSKDLMAVGFYVFNQFSSNSGAVPFLEKHLKRMALGEKLKIYIPECNIIDFIIFNNNTIPIYDNNSLDFSDMFFKKTAKLTNLDGLEVLAKNINALSITKINFNNNFLVLNNNFSFLKYFQNIRILNLSKNKLTQLSENIFNNLVQLRTLDLSKNKLIQLSENIFNNLVQLRILDLSKNELMQLPANVFDSFQQLQSLNLSENQLMQLLANIFNNLVQLRRLDLSANQLIQLPANIFNNLVQLQELNLSDNQLTELPENIVQLLDRLNQLHQ